MTNMRNLFVLTLAFITVNYNTNSLASEFITSYTYDGRSEYTRDVLVNNETLYMANGYWGVRAVNIADLENPTSVDNYYPGAGRESVELAARGNILIVADRQGGTKFIDISNPNSLNYLSMYPSYDRASRLALDDHNLYVGDRAGGLVVLDISDPTTPVEIGRHERDYETQGIAIKEDYAFVANPWHGFYTLDISNLNDIKEIAYYDKPVGTFPGIWDVGIKGNYAYLLCQRYGVQVVDISNPYSPEFVDELLLPEGQNPSGGDSPPLDIAFAGNNIIISNGLDGVYVIDIYNPEDIFIVEHIETPGFAMGLDISNNMLFVADARSGVQIFDIHEYTSVPIPSSGLLLFVGILSLSAMRRKKI